MKRITLLQVHIRHRFNGSFEIRNARKKSKVLPKIVLFHHGNVPAHFYELCVEIDGVRDPNCLTSPILSRFCALGLPPPVPKMKKLANGEEILFKRGYLIAMYWAIHTFRNGSTN